MNWERVLRNTQAIKTSVLTTMESREFHSKVKRLGDLDDSTQTLHKDVKQLNEREMNAFKAEKKLVGDLCSCSSIREDPSLRDALQRWNEHIKYHEDYLNSMINDTSRVMIEPIKRLLTEFPKIKEMIKKRDQLLIEYEKCQQKVDKLKKKERTGPNVVKLDTARKSLSAIKKEFEEENEALLDYMTSLYEQRADYLTPSIHALINIEICHIAEGFRFYSELEASVDTQKDKGQEESAKDDRFNEFKSLTIVSTD
ncbi:bridging integrator 3-like [Watersipora subatra]|uniref:bridging integrator 3-like n=1 Tax=Watersipora subatra TaxID=2589382 RepID=UPI00355C4E40